MSQDEQAINQNANINGTLKHEASTILRDFYDLHPLDPLLTQLDNALEAENISAVHGLVDQLFDRLPTNPIRANKLYKILSGKNNNTAHIILSRYQARKYKEQLGTDIKDRIAFMAAQLELDEAEIESIRNKIARNIEPALKASNDRIQVLEEKIEKQRAIVDEIQNKVDTVAERLANTKISLQEAILEQTRLDNEIALLLEEDEDEEDEEGSGSSGKGDKDRLKQQKGGQKRIAELMQEEINHLTLNQKAADRELENAKAQLASLETQLSEELSVRADIEEQLALHKERIAELEEQNSINESEIAKLEIDREFIQSAMFTEAFNALSGDIPIPEAKERELTTLIEKNAKSDTLLSAIDDAHYAFLSEQEQQNQQAQDSQAEQSGDMDDLNFDRDLELESATDHAIRMAMTMQADNTLNMDDFDSLMEALPDDLRKKVAPEVTSRLEQKGVNITKDLGAKQVSEAAPKIFDPKSVGPQNEIKSPSLTVQKAAELRTAFADSQAFKKYNAPGVEASYDTKPIKGVDPNIFQKGLNNSNFEPARDNTGPAQQQPKPQEPSPEKPKPSSNFTPDSPIQM